MGKSDWTETKKRDSSHLESIWFYVGKIDHGSDISTMTCDGAVSDGPKRLAFSIYWLGEGVR